MPSSRSLVWCVVVLVIVLWNTSAGVDGSVDHKVSDMGESKEAISGVHNGNETWNMGASSRKRRGSGKNHQPTRRHEQLPHLDRSNVEPVVLSNRQVSRNTRSPKHELEINGVEIRHLPSRRRHPRGLYDWLGENTGRYKTPRIRPHRHLPHVDEANMDPVKLAHRANLRNTRSQKKNLKVNGVEIGHLPLRHRHSRGLWDTWLPKKPVQNDTQTKESESDEPLPSSEELSEERATGKDVEQKGPKKENVPNKKTQPKKDNIPKKETGSKKETGPKKEVDPNVEKGTNKKKDLKIDLPSHARKPEKSNVPVPDGDNIGDTIHLDITNGEVYKIDEDTRHGSFVLKPENMHYSIPSYTFDFNSPSNMEPIFIQLPEIGPLNTGHSYVYSNVEPDRIIAVNSGIPVPYEGSVLQQPRRIATEAEHLQEGANQDSNQTLPDGPLYRLPPLRQTQYPQMLQIPYSQTYASQMPFYLEPHTTGVQYPTLPQSQTVEPQNMFQQFYPPQKQYPFQSDYQEMTENVPQSQYPNSFLTQNQMNPYQVPYPQTYPNQYQQHQSYPPQTQYHQPNMWQWNGGLGSQPTYQNSYPSWYWNQGYPNPSVPDWGIGQVQGNVAYADRGTVTDTNPIAENKRPLKRSAPNHPSAGSPVVSASKPFNILPYPAIQAAIENGIALGQTQLPQTMLKYTSDAYQLKKTPSFVGWVPHNSNNGHE